MFDDQRAAVEALDRTTLLEYIPMTVLCIAALSYYAERNGIRRDDLYSLHDLSLVRLAFDPFYHAATVVVHSGWQHFSGNMLFFVPLGILLTWLTSNRHVLLVIVATVVPTNFVAGAAGQFGFGASTAVFGLFAAVLVRSAGYAFQDASANTLQDVVATLLILGGTAFFAVFILAGGRTEIGHFAHFLGFLFGGAVESLYIFHGHDTGA